MNRWQFRGPILVALILIAASLFASQSRMDIPPSVSSNEWVALSAQAGIQITEKPAITSGRPSGARGQLWVKVDGTWVPTLIEQPRTFVPAS